MHFSEWVPDSLFNGILNSKSWILDSNAHWIPEMDIRLMGQQNSSCNINVEFFQNFFFSREVVRIKDVIIQEELPSYLNNFSSLRLPEMYCNKKGEFAF